MAVRREGGLPHRIHGTGIFTYIRLKVMVNVSKYSIHGAFGLVTFQSRLWR